MSLRILLVDDDDNFRAVAAAALESAGYRVVEVENGYAALTYLRGDRPDVIISDLDMPVLSGRQLCAQVRARAELATIPFLLLTSRLEDDSADSPLSPQADYCFSKQGSFARVLACIAELQAARKRETEQRNALE
jgi:CheY-like chemotaxis protein